MTPRALIVTYHAIEAGPAPLFVEPKLLERHLDCIVDAGAAVLTIGELGDALRTGALPARAVSLTFDDGFASIATNAAPLLAERGLRATVFCVSAHLGGRNDWPSQPASAPRVPLADAAALRELAAAGWEIASHGVTHAPLGELAPEAVERELVDSRRTLEEAVGVPVSSFAWPYGSVPRAAPAALGEAGYRAACTTAIALVEQASSPHALPRVDAHYLRRPAVLDAVLGGRVPGYLGARRILAAARRRVRADFADVGGRP